MSGSLFGGPYFFSQFTSSSVLAHVQGQAPNLNENCTVSILNRVVRVNRDGSFEIPNIPTGQGLVRVTAVCVNGGLTTGGHSQFFAPLRNGTAVIGEIPLGPLAPVPQSLSIAASPTTLGAAGSTTQLTATATFPGGSTKNVTAKSAGTTYVSSNQAIATVSDDGLVTAGSTSGTAIISARNEGLLATLAIAVSLGNDTDGDGLPNDFEAAYPCLNPVVADAGANPDADGLTNLQEFGAGTDPCRADTDGDGLNDGNEIARGTLPTVPDTDLDGLTDGDEVTRGSNPLNRDTDGDALPDGVEVRICGTPFCANPFADNDGDGLNNLNEIQIFTDPTDPDTDDDGLNDGEEVLRGTDPLVPDSTRPVVTITSPAGGSQLIEGQTITVAANATDDGRVTRVEFTAAGTGAGVDSTSPFSVAFTVPVGVAGLTFGATAFDTNNNSGTAPPVSVTVIPDPLTRVVGRVVDIATNPVTGAAVSTFGTFTSTTGADGTFSIPGVPTVRGDIRVDATATVGGKTLRGTSVSVAPVRGGTTNVGDVVVRHKVPIAITFDAGSDSPRSYTESGLTVTSLVEHLHFDLVGALSNHSGCCSTPYEFTFGGSPFNVVSLDVVVHSSGTHTFTSSTGAVVTVTGVGTHVFPAAGWEDITSFRWDATGNMAIDNLVIEAEPVVGALRATAANTDNEIFIIVDSAKVLSGEPATRTKAGTPAPLTTVVGKLADTDGNPLSGVTIVTGGYHVTTKSADGSFSIYEVPTAYGDIQVFVVGRANGKELRGNSSAVSPTPSGTTDVGRVVVK